MADEIDDLLGELPPTESSNFPSDSSVSRDPSSNQRASTPVVTPSTSSPELAPDDKSSNRLIFGAAGLFLLLSAVAIGSYFLGSRSDDDESDNDPAPAAAVVTQASAELETAQSTAAATTTVPDPPSTTAATLPPIEPTEDNPEGAVRWSVFSGGKFYLRGFYRTQEAGDRIVEILNATAGPENVIAEFEINPAAPAEAAAPVYIEDVILFKLGSATLEPEFRALLDLAPAFLSQDPKIKIKVIARTDASGSAETNLDLAQRRADSIVAYYLSIGVDPLQVESDPRGEEGFEETDDPIVAAKQRRVEFVVTGLLG